MNDAARLRSAVNPRPRYDMLAIDLDGTLLDSDGRVSATNLDALNDARHADLEVIICTGRGATECAGVLDAIGQRSPVVVAGGSIVACRRTGDTLHRFDMKRQTVIDAVNRLTSHGHPVMILKDPVVAGYEYLVVAEPGTELHPVSLWWFERMGVRVRRAENITHDEHPECTVRIGVCGDEGDMAGLLATIEHEFRHLASMHHFPAVVSLNSNGRRGNGRDSEACQEHRVHILELFHPDADKWASLCWLARRRGVPTSRIAAIGDEINDVGMVRGAGLGVAMENAVPSVCDAATQHTRSNDDDGVAFAIERILSGRW